MSDGPEFYQTGYGKRFFDSQLPDLIKQLTRIADALEAILRSRGEND
jgi:hypothetical protein